MPGQRSLTRKVVALLCLAIGAGPASVAACHVIAPGDDSKLEVIGYSWFMKGEIPTTVFGPLEGESRRAMCRQESECDPERMNSGSEPIWMSGVSSDRLEPRFIYQIKVLNRGLEAITNVVWEYLFFDPDTQELLNRRVFVNECDIRPGAAQMLSSTSVSPPTWVISAASPGGPDYREEVHVKAVTYARRRQVE